LPYEIEQHTACEPARLRFAVVSLIVVLGIAACGKVSPQQSLSGSANPQALGGSGNPQQPPSTGAAILNWDPVTKDTSGNILQDLAGYKIHYGTSAQAMDIIETQTNPNETTYTINNLSPGTWYFAVSAYTTSNTESAPSDVASKTIN